MHIYAFGSICRGDWTPESDVDLLAIVNGIDMRFDPTTFSIYSYERVRQLWLEGNAFAWHLSLEARLIYASDNQDVIDILGKPATYKTCAVDCGKFTELFHDARVSLAVNASCVVFDLSTIFLSIRNFATCFSLGVLATPDFSRHSALHLGPDSLEIDSKAYGVLERARLLSVRGRGSAISASEVAHTMGALSAVERWMSALGEKIHHERVQ
jgi:hypothetical protein